MSVIRCSDVEMHYSVFNPREASASPKERAPMLARGALFIYLAEASSLSCIYRLALKINAERYISKSRMHGKDLDRRNR